jgi:hypothetical protein
VRPSSVSTAAVLDDAGDLLALVAAPWAGLLWLAALPVRFLQALFAERLLDLGEEAGKYGRHLTWIAAAATAAWLLALWGRAVYARACLLALRARAPRPREVLRVPPAALASYVYAALVLEVLFYVLVLSVLAVPFLLTLGALAAATCHLNERPGLVQPLRNVAAHSRDAGVLLALLFVFGAAILLTYLNLFFLFQAGAWAAGAIPGVDAIAWRRLFAFDNERFNLVLAAGAATVVEPAWLAAHVAYVANVRARESAEDLREWFAAIREGARA